MASDSPKMEKLSFFGVSGAVFSLQLPKSFIAFWTLNSIISNMSGAKTMKLEMNTEFPYEEESSHAGLGSTRQVGWAVKGTPFRVLLKVVSKSKVSLAHAQVHLQLLTEETYAPIEIGDRPVTWEHSSSGSVISCDVRLQVLSTQVRSILFALLNIYSFHIYLIGGECPLFSL